MKVRVATALAVLLLLPACSSAVNEPDPTAQMCQGFRQSDAALLLEPANLVAALIDPAVADPSRAEVEEMVRAAVLEPSGEPKVVLLQLGLDEGQSPGPYPVQPGEVGPCDAGQLSE